ncbi:MAG: dihydrodipicolinate synthase family protein [Chloroflexi bacterium]|nr:dihydrodipicolinate synthase family protein [Chloroflexota bacterium]
MNPDVARSRLRGCYVTIPTIFHDDTLAIDLDAIRQHVRFLIDGGLVTGTAVLLTGGAAGGFSTLTFDERIQVAEAVVEEAAGRVPIVMGAQTTSTLELIRLAKAAERVGAEFIQVSPPFYFEHSEDDFYEYVVAAAEAASVGLIIYNTFWTSIGVSAEMVEKFQALPNVIGLKWSMPDKGNMEFEQVISRFAKSFSIIDNQMRFVTSHMLGARGIEVHVCNYWPQWGVHIWKLLENGEYIEAQHELVKVAMPFMALWQEMEQYTSGDGYLDKLCMELVGLRSSRCRPPTRDVRAKYRERARRMLLQCGVPNVLTTE